MDKRGEIQLLLDCWSEIIKTCAKDSLKNASRMKGGLDTRIQPGGKKQVFDYKSEERQKEIQNKLYYLIPEYTMLIASEPSILDEEWSASDYIELYHNHYALVIEKLRKTI